MIEQIKLYKNLIGISSRWSVFLHWFFKDSNR